MFITVKIAFIFTSLPTFHINDFYIFTVWQKGIIDKINWNSRKYSHVQVQVLISMMMALVLHHTIQKDSASVQDSAREWKKEKKKNVTPFQITFDFQFNIALKIPNFML